MRLSILMTILLFPLTVLADNPAAEKSAAPDAPLAPMSFLAGQCWKGAFPKQVQTDEHCFEWVYEGRFLRDRHVVRDAEGKSTGLGETIYYWDSGARQIQFLYIENQGGISRGTVEVVPDGLNFPPTDYIADGEQQTYRSHWQRIGDDAYQSVNDFKIKDRWVTAWNIKMEKQPAK